MEVPKEEVHKYGVIEGNRIEEGVYMVSNMVENLITIKLRQIWQ